MSDEPEIGTAEWWQQSNLFGTRGVADAILRLLEQGEISRAKARELTLNVAHEYAQRVSCERCRHSTPDAKPAPWHRLNWCDDGGPLTMIDAEAERLDPGHLLRVNAELRNERDEARRIAGALAARMTGAEDAPLPLRMRLPVHVAGRHPQPHADVPRATGDVYMTKIVIDGIEYVPDQPRAGKRVVLVVDRGWIFAGDVVRDDERVVLERAVWVFNWNAIGFDAVLANPKQDDVNIRPLTTVVDVPRASEVFRLPVGDDWGL